MTSEMAVSSPPANAALVRPVAVKLPLRAVSDRMNVDAGGVELPSRRPGKAGFPAAGAAGDGDRFPLSVNENASAETAADERWPSGGEYDAGGGGGGGGGGEVHSNSDDEVCNVFSRARRFQAAVLSSWLSRDVVLDGGRCCVGLLRAAAAALAAGNAGMARSTRWTALHDGRVAAVMNAVELPRPCLDFTKMQVSSQ